MKQRPQTDFEFGRRSFAPFVVGCFALFVTEKTVVGQPVIDREPQIKAAYVYRFLNYVHWPADQFVAAQSPIVMGGVGNDTVNRYLETIAKSKKAGQRPLQYRDIKSADDARGCHVIFVSSSAPAELLAELLKDDGSEALYIGESPKFIANGGVINFVIRDNKVRFELSRVNASRRGLRVSSKLARLAIIVN